MSFVNVVYDYEYDEIKDLINVTGSVDIISVPDYVCKNLNDIVQKFFDWLSSTKEHGYFKQDIDGHEYLVAGADEFVKWLNEYFLCESQEAAVIKKDVVYNPHYPLAEF